MKASLQPKPMYCSRDYYYSSRFNQQYEKPTPIIPNELHVQSGMIPRHETIGTNSLEEVIVPPPNSQQVEHNAPAIEMELNPLNLEVRTQRDNIGTNGENNISSNQASGNVMLSLSVVDLTPSPNVNMELENNSDTSRGSHVRPREVGL